MLCFLHENWKWSLVSEGVHFIASGVNANSGYSSSGITLPDELRRVYPLDTSAYQCALCCNTVHDVLHL